MFIVLSLLFRSTFIIVPFDIFNKYKNKRNVHMADSIFKQNFFFHWFEKSQAGPSQIFYLTMLHE